MRIFHRRTAEEKRTAEVKKIRKVRTDKDPYGFKAMRRGEERAAIWRDRRS